MFDINLYHWVWYLIGLVVYPQLTFMILLSIYVKGIPAPLMIAGWIIACCETFRINKEK
jgi:hypothetical protein